jgi:hypothetical protein
MPHPLEWIPSASRRLTLFAFLFLTFGLFAIFRVLDQPLRTPAAPNGIVSFELAGSPAVAQSMLDSWNAQAKQSLAFGLGIDYLFMPAYAIALGLATLLSAGRHAGWMKSLGALAGWGALVAALFDAVENFALWRILLGEIILQWTCLATVCAIIKFGLLFVGLVSVFVAALLPVQRGALAKN